MGFVQDTINSILGNSGSGVDPVSYAAFLRDRAAFQKAGGLEGNDFSQLDTPGHFFFKILFYFNNGDSTGSSGLSGGLLAPTWEEYEASGSEDYYARNSAWSFLKMNYENERAELLKKFVTLLSNISSESPWYFKSVSGLGNALKRESVGKENFIINAEKKNIQIKCLADAYDTRIGTLLDLYRTITWSWTRKCEILPRNLRKFDMGIYIFSSPIANLHDPENTVLNSDSNSYSTSYKLIEFHGCEIDYNSSASMSDELSNESGQPLEYTITIDYDDAYERRWNEGMMRLLGDIITIDTMSRIYSNEELAATMVTPTGNWKIDAVNLLSTASLLAMAGTENVGQVDIESKAQEFNDRVNKYKSGFLKGMTDQLLGEIKGAAGDLVNGVVLGNLHGFSLSRVGEQLEQLASGQIIQTVQNIGDYARNTEMGAGLSSSFLMDQGRKILQSATGDAVNLASEISDTTKNLNEIKTGNQESQQNSGGDLGRIFRGRGAASAANTIASNL